MVYMYGCFFSSGTSSQHFPLSKSKASRRCEPAIFYLRYEGGHQGRGGMVVLPVNRLNNVIYLYLIGSVTWRLHGGEVAQCRASFLVGHENQVSGGGDHWFSSPFAISQLGNHFSYLAIHEALYMLMCCLIDLVSTAKFQ
jgi:hypothetical protein